MKCPTVLLCLCLCLTANNTIAQAYPDSSASWCFDDLNNSDLFQIRMTMGPDPDTVILGQTYKRIGVYAIHDWQPPELVQNYYVRSDPSGKGYVMLLDSMQEYLAIDVGANVGDTVQDVLTVSSWESNAFYWIQPVIIDSAVTLENNGVTVTRKFIHAQSFIPYPQDAFQIFWQEGIGGSYGPLINLTSSSGFTMLNCLHVQDTYVFSIQSGLPGVPCDCALATVGITEVGPNKEGEVQEGLRLFPNPADGFFAVIADFFPEKDDANVRVYGPTGNLALSFAMQGPKHRVDASGLHGLFMVVVESAGVLKTAKIILQ